MKNSDTSSPRSDLALIETILWENGAYFLPGLHMDRLERSAHYFASRLASGSLFPCNRPDIEKKLATLASHFDPSEKHRVRLLLKKGGELDLTSEILNTPDAYPAKIAVSDKRTDRNDIFLPHKTTNRLLYDRELAKYRADGFFDVIFLNQDNEVTEGAITNIMIRKGKDHLTPPLSSGLLGGVYRQWLLKTGELCLKEKILYRKDIQNADKIFVINSVRKMVPAVLAG
ncbi:MAG: hypothetical protein DRP85_05210 [Candidatus Makaraimicrobium thalassicum]|nr:MAG: hypothetical protein DRP85_05210 [Candidatus Omnitrophota bacterium]